MYVKSEYNNTHVFLIITTELFNSVGISIFTRTIDTHSIVTMFIYKSYKIKISMDSIDIIILFYFFFLNSNSINISLVLQSWT